MFVQLQQPAVKVGPVSSGEQTSCKKTGMCLFDGFLEIRMGLGGKRICQQCEWIIVIDAVQRWHNFQSPIYLSAVCLCLWAKHVTGSERACEPVDEVFPSTVSES